LTADVGFPGSIVLSAAVLVRLIDNPSGDIAGAITMTGTHMRRTNE
jgi:hypothetical protein